MKKKGMIGLLLSLLTVFILVVGVFAGVNKTSYTEMKGSETEGLEMEYPPQPIVALEPEESTYELEEDLISEFEYEGNEHEDPMTNDDEINDHEINEDEEGQPLGLSTYDYVIITTNAIVDNSEELEHFIHMKEFCGFSVKVVTETDFLGLTGSPPNDRADKIRQWLINNYQTLGIDYVLLVGDPDPDDTKNPTDHVGDIPMKMCWPRYFRVGTGAPTDLYYGDLDSNWDLDGDGFYFEMKDYNSPTSPDPSIASDTFSVLWTGEVMCDYNVDYIFKTISDDGVRLKIDGSFVIDNWVEHGPTVDEWTANMTVGKHTINLLFRENYGDGIIKLSWRTEVPSNSPAFVDEIIPSDHLYDANGNVGGLTGFYYDNNDFTGYKLTRVDPEISFEWGTGDMGSGHPDLEAEVFVGRIPVYDNNYTQLDAILRKIIDYETDPGNIDWRKSILLPMARMSPTTTSTGLGEAIKQSIAIPNGFSSYRIYEKDFAPSGPTPDLWPCEYDTVWNEWKNGYGMVTWHTHGGQGHASHVIHRDNLSHLDDSKPAFTFQASCDNAYPENKENLAYSLLKHGGIAIVTATRMSTYKKGDYITFNPTKYLNHQMAYFYTKKVIDEGMPAGMAYSEVVKYHSKPNANAIEFNLYGDPNCYLLTTFPNLPPVADANGPYTADEGSPITFDASGSYDPEGDPLEYRWDFDNDGIWETDWLAVPTVSYTYGDDFNGVVKVEVRDQIGKTDIDTTTVNIYNVAPTIEEIEAYILVDFTLRAAGEKWHNVEMYILEDSTQIGYAEVVRYPGSPDDQSETLVDVKCDVSKIISVKVLYTPANDPVNGQPNGATPCWVNISFEDGGYNYSHHTFNVKHPDTWEWIIGVNQYFVGHEITFEADASDPGSDDLTFNWFWDDATPDTQTIYYNNGVGPDPYPSPGGIYPVSQFDKQGHIFTTAGNYNVTLTVTDDDGGTSSVVIIVILI